MQRNYEGLLSFKNFTSEVHISFIFIQLFSDLSYLQNLSSVIEKDSSFIETCVCMVCLYQLICFENPATQQHAINWLEKLQRKLFVASGSLLNERRLDQITLTFFAFGPALSVSVGQPEAHFSASNFRQQFCKVQIL